MSVSVGRISFVALGGLIGMLAVDPNTGGMYVFPETVTGTLDAATKTSQGTAALTIVSTESLSSDQLRQARLLAATN